MTVLVPLVRQAYDYSCGAASLASCLYYWGVWSGREPELYHLLGTDEDGTSGSAIMETAKSFGLEVQYQNNLNINELNLMLLEGWTIILNIQAWGNYDTSTDFSEVWEDGHYVVLVNLIEGQDGGIGYVEVMDPSVAGQYARLSEAVFEARWHDWSDDGESKEYHTAILIKGRKVNDLAQPYIIG